MHLSPVMASLAAAFHIPINTLRPVASLPQRSLQASLRSTTRSAPFSTTPSQYARKQTASKPDKRITMIRYHLYHPTRLMPRPLRFSRTRALRHWTIHRAWQLHRAGVKQGREQALERQWNAMRDACEELRVGAGDGGRLFRKAMIKSGVWAHGGVPIEYSRGMMDWVGAGAVGASAKALGGRIWNTAWKRA